MIKTYVEIKNNKQKSLLRQYFVENEFEKKEG